MKKTKFRIAAILILIFSFLLSFISLDGSSVNALEDKYVKEKVEIDSISLVNKNIEFYVDDNHDLTLATYEFTYYINNVLISELKVDDELNSNGKGFYSFDIITDHEIEGVKIWKLTYPLSDSYHKSKFTIGSNTYGNINSTLKKDWLRIDSKLVPLNSTANSIVDYIKNTLNPITISKNSYGLYFTFDLKNDYVADITIEYTTYYKFEPLKQSWVANFKSDKQTVREEIYNNDKDLIDFSATGVLKGFSKIMSPYTDTPFNESIYKLKDSTEYDYLAVINSKLNNYSTWLYNVKAIVDEVAILEVGYYYEGEYFSKDVVNEDTGYTYFVYQQIEDEADDKMWIAYLIIGLILFGIIVWFLTPVITGIKYIVLTIYYVVKYLLLGIWFVISLPFRLVGFCFNGDTESKEQKKKEKRNKKLRKNGYNRNNSNYNFR